MSDYLLDFATLSKKIRLSRYTIYILISDDTFPKARKIGKASRWINSEIEEWMISLPTSSVDVPNCPKIEK
ncbi:helix-turn-helix transcriptional regulator [Pseudomonas sp. SZMC_28357]|uniref:helix-turn-helix transcriptional regulator n=1 Tax=Pseudomonas sp. SZMC_28357 TaxID=3074380 RepID=UPI0038F6F97B